MALPPSASFHLQRLGVTEGLDHPSMKALHQDQRGFLWFANERSLQRYDGYRWVAFHHDPADPNTLSESQVTAIAEDRAGNLWFGTRERGLNRYDPEQGRFDRFLPDAEDPSRLTPGQVLSVVEDPEDGSLWVGTAGGLNRLDPASGEVVRYPHQAEGRGPSGSSIVDLLIDRAGNLWVGSLSGLDRWDPATERFHPVARDPSDPDSPGFDQFSALLEDSEGALWVGGWDGVLHVSRGWGQPFEKVDPEPDLASTTGRGIWALAEDSVGDLWVGTEDRGLLRRRRGSDRFERMTHQPGELHSLGSNRVVGLLEDRSSVLWIATDAGLARWSLDHRQFRRYSPPTFRTEEQSLLGLPGPDVMALAESPTGTWWVGTEGDGLAQHDPASGTFEAWFAAGVGRDALSQSPVRALVETQDGTLWVGTHDGVLRLRRGIVARVDGVEGNVNALEEDSAGNVWVLTTVGAYQIDPRDLAVEHFAHDFEMEGGWAANRMFRAVEESPGVLWAVTQGGLTQIEADTHRLQLWRHGPGEPGPSSDHLVALHRDGRGDLWLGSYGSGLDHWDRENDRWHNYRERDGLPSDRVLAILEDDQQHLWLSTNNGLARLDPSTGSILSFLTAEGLRGDAFFMGSALRARDGTLAFGGPDGFVTFRPETLRVAAQRPRVELTEVLVFDEPLRPRFEDPESPLVGSVIGVQDLVLEHHQKTLAFEFAALHYVSPRHNRYTYQLEGYDSDWVTTDADHRLARYTNLDPGSYVFRVRAASPGGELGVDGRTLRITLLPSPWRSWWAYSTYGLLLGAAILGVDRSQKQRLIRRERHRAEIRESRVRTQAAEIEAEALREVAERKDQELLKAQELAQATEDLATKNRQLEDKSAQILATQRQLQEKTGYLNALVESSPVALVVLDAEGCIRLCNPAFETLFRYDEAEIVGRRLRNLIALEENQDEVAQSIKKTRRGEVVHLDATYRRCKGGQRVEVEVHAVPLMVTGEYAGSFALYRDIGERMRAERAIFEEKERAQVTLDSIGDAVITTDAQGIVDYLNPVAEDLTGMSRERACGQALGKVFWVVDEKTRRRVEDPATRCLAGAGLIAPSERRVLIDASGKEYPVRDSAAPIRDRDGQILGVVLVFKDVTAERRMAQQMIQSEKMASLGQLVAGVAHEINNPVNFVSSGLPSLRRNLDKLTALVCVERYGQPLETLRQRIDQLLGAIEEGAQRTAEIVLNLRTFSRLEEEAVKMADLHRALDTTLSLLHNQTKHTICIDKQYGDLPGIECFLGQLNQVFMNILVNAIQAIEGSGTITISTARVGRETVRVSIRDTGRGMTEKVRRRIFDPFFSTKPEGQGTGLGLSISHGIVEKHGGSITVKSQPGRGSEFNLMLPVRIERSAVAALRTGVP